MEAIVWKKYKIISDPSEVSDFLGDTPSPFNLATDYKTFCVKNPDELAITVASELDKGGPRKDVCRIKGSLQGPCILKIRCQDDGNGKGKSQGLRAYVLVIPILATAVILGIRNHTKGSQKRTTLLPKDDKMLDQLYSSIIDSLETI